MKNELKQLKEKLLKKGSFRKEIKRQDLSFEIAESIIDARIKIGMTQKKLAKKMKTKQSGIARWESGRCLPSFKNLEKMAKILKIRIINPLVDEEINEPYFKVPKEFIDSKSEQSGNKIFKENIVNNQIHIN